MDDMTTNLFVYGTLMPGETNYRQIEDLVIDHKKGTIEGDLVDLGAFPSLLPGDGIVKGVMLQMDAQALKTTDNIEGYHPERRHSLYVRKEVSVRFEGGQEAVAWTYFFGSQESISDCPRLVIGESSGIPIFAWCSK